MLSKKTMLYIYIYIQIENPMNKVDIKKQHLKWSFSPTFKEEKQFHNRAVAIEQEKPIYIGATTLDLINV